MRYSLASRFQGAWLGSILGEYPTISLNNFNFSAQSAIRYGLTAARHIAAVAIANHSVEPQAVNWTNQTAATSARVAVMMLPMVLLEHEERFRLQSRLADALASGPFSSEQAAEVMLWGDALSLVLQDTVAPDPWIAQLLNGTQGLSTPLREAIATLPSALAACQSLAAIQRQWSSHLNPDQLAIALALYCFAATPESFTVALARARRARCHAAMLPALVGTISGAYNSLSGLPYRYERVIPAIIKQEISQEADRLFAVWSGRLSTHPLPASASAIAPAGTLQPRSGCNIISQNRG
jgi:hypothetical protein